MSKNLEEAALKNIIAMMRRKEAEALLEDDEKPDPKSKKKAKPKPKVFALLAEKK